MSAGYNFGGARALEMAAKLSAVARRNRKEVTPKVLDDAFVLIERAARRGETCPSNTEIAARLGIGMATASRLVLVLEERGQIRVERGNSSRVATIVASAQRTAGTVSNPHWRAAPADPAERERLAEERKERSRRGVACRVARMAAAPLPQDAAVALAARIERDQAALHAERFAWLDEEQRRYALPRRGRLPEEMAA